MQDSTAGPDPSQSEALASAKEKMRAALDRKRTGEHRTAEGRRNTGSVHGADASGAATKRMFRRKSG